MVQGFRYTHTQLHGMTVPNLRLLVRKHNYVNSIRGYSKMRKKELVKALLFHSPMRKNTRVDKLGQALVGKQLQAPLYGKKSVQKGATDDFNKRYGKGEKKKAAPPKKPPVFVALPKRKAKKPSRYR